MTWREQLPTIRAENEVWRKEYLPRVREHQRQQAERRAHVGALITRGLTAIEATDQDRAKVFELTGFGK